MVKVTDTSKPEKMREHFDYSIVLGSSEYIEQSEKHGQNEVVNSTQLPTDIRNREIFEEWGFIFGEPCKDDPLFCDAQMPQGWTKQATQHSMWTDILDEQGHKRASIFYKAAFYDRDALMRPCQRFVIIPNYDNKSKDIIEMNVECDDKILYSERVLIGVSHADKWRNRRQADNEAQKACEDWLDKNYPGWNHPVKSWEIKIRANG